MGHFIFQTPVVLSIFSNLLGLVTLCATVMFCTSMNKLAMAYSLDQSASSWLMTRLLVIIFWVIPLGILYLIGTGNLLMGTPSNLNIGFLVIPLLIAMLIPLVHLFISTSRMRREAESPDIIYTDQQPQYFD